MNEKLQAKRADIRNAIGTVLTRLELEILEPASKIAQAAGFDPAEVRRFHTAKLTCGSMLNELIQDQRSEGIAGKSDFRSEDVEPLPIEEAREKLRELAISMAKLYRLWASDVIGPIHELQADYLQYMGEHQETLEEGESMHEEFEKLSRVAQCFGILTHRISALALEPSKREQQNLPAAVAP